jgi:transcriptional regulator with XRE-family HTH domain
MSEPDAKFWKEARLKRSLSQADVAKILGYSSPQLVSNWERGLCNPPQKHLSQLLKLYKINVNDYIELVIAYEKKKLKKLLKHNNKSVS